LFSLPFLSQSKPMAPQNLDKPRQARGSSVFPILYTAALPRNAG
jgi:hypothetical protein